MLLSVVSTSIADWPDSNCHSDLPDGDDHIYFLDAEKAVQAGRRCGADIMRQVIVRKIGRDVFLLQSYVNHFQALAVSGKKDVTSMKAYIRRGRKLQQCGLAGSICC